MAATRIRWDRLGRWALIAVFAFVLYLYVGPLVSWVSTYREAGNHQLVRHIPGDVEYTAVTLKYGVTKSRELWDWMMKAAEGNVQRKNVSILLLDSQGDSEVMRWSLIDAWPSEWQGAALNASEKTLAIETLTIVYDRLERS